MHVSRLWSYRAAEWACFVGLHECDILTGSISERENADVLRSLLLGAFQKRQSQAEVISPH